MNEKKAIKQFRKKGDGLTMQTIVIAALALSVLFVLFLIFRGQTGKTTVSLTKVGDEAGYQADRALGEF